MNICIFVERVTWLVGGTSEGWHHNCSADMPDILPLGLSSWKSPQEVVHNSQTSEPAAKNKRDLQSTCAQWPLIKRQLGILRSQAILPNPLLPWNPWQTRALTEAAMSLERSHLSEEVNGRKGLHRKLGLLQDPALYMSQDIFWD